MKLELVIVQHQVFYYRNNFVIIDDFLFSCGSSTFTQIALCKRSGKTDIFQVSKESSDFVQKFNKINNTGLYWKSAKKTWKIYVQPTQFFEKNMSSNHILKYFCFFWKILLKSTLPSASKLGTYWIHITSRLK